LQWAKIFLDHGPACDQPGERNGEKNERYSDTQLPGWDIVNPKEIHSNTTLLYKSAISEDEEFGRGERIRTFDFFLPKAPSTTISTYFSVLYKL